MAIDNFIPDLWSAAVETEYLATQVVIPTIAGKYTGEVARGNTVKITGAVTPTITDYAAAPRTITAEAINDDGQDLNIDQEKAWSIILDDIDKIQSAGSLDAWAASAGRALAEDAESFMINKLLTQSWSMNVTGDTPLTITTYAHAKAALLAVRKALTNRKIPEGNRYAVANPAFVTLLLDGLADNSIAGGSNELRNGFVTRLFGMDVLESPLLGDAAKPTVVAYHESSAAFVSQMQETEALRHQTKFADIVRGLNVYGGKVIRQFGTASFVSGGTTQNAFSSFLS